MINTLEWLRLYFCQPINKENLNCFANDIFTSKKEAAPQETASIYHGINISFGILSAAFG